VVAALAVADFLVGGGGSHVLPHASVVLYDHDALQLHHLCRTRVSCRVCCGVGGWQAGCPPQVPAVRGCGCPPDSISTPHTHTHDFSEEGSGENRWAR
jgi:hypothetical protein